MTRTAIILATLIILLTTAAVAARDGAPRPVSPGSPEASRLTAASCPTFDWAGVAGADAYELVAYRTTDAAERVDEDPVLHEFLPGAATGWTPSVDRCLEPGGSYAWSLRARRGDATSEWSPPSLFTVAAPRPRAGVAVVEPPAATEAPAGLRPRAPRFAADGPTSGAGIFPTPDEAAVTGETGATTDLTVGVHGISNSTGNNSAGVVGESTASSGETAGVVGLVDNADGVAFFGENSATSGFAVGIEVTTHSAGGITASFNNEDGGKILSAAVGGMEKFSVDGDGNINFEGALIGAGSGQSSVNGNFSVGGELTKGSGSFLIDHPLDPANKTLSHSFVESPDMKNVYDGLVTLSADGSAWIELPDWFQALNSDYRYQLTAVGAPMPSLYVAEEVAGNRFRIGGGPAGGRVSWQVTGIRQDAFARAHRIRVEEEKPAHARGTYLHPELFATAAPDGEALAAAAESPGTAGGR